MSNLFFGQKIADFTPYADTIYTPGDVTEVADPVGVAAGKVIRMTVDDSHNDGVTANPRAQLASGAIITSGMEFWMATEILFPVGHPTIKSWLTVNVPMWGPPFGGTGAPAHAEASYDRCINWERTGLYNYDGPIEGESPWPRGKWIQILWHVKFAEAGWVELWLNGVQVHFFKPGQSYNPKKRAETTKLEMQTRQAGTNDEGDNHSAISYYREKGQYTTGTAYYKGLTLATSEADLNLAKLKAGIGGEEKEEEEEEAPPEEGYEAYKEVILGDAPVAYWRLGEASGITAADISGNNFPATYENGPTKGVTGALEFDTDTAVAFGGAGTGQRMSVPEHAALKLGDTFTWELWFKRGDKGVAEILMSNPSAAATPKIQLTTENQIRLRAAGTGNVMTTTAKVTDELWHHLVVVKNGSTSAKIYLDSVDVGGTVTNFTMASGTVIQIAQEGNEELFKGSLDEIAIYGRALSAAEVEEHYAAAFAEPPEGEEEEPPEEPEEEEEEPPIEEGGEEGEEEAPPEPGEEIRRGSIFQVPKMVAPITLGRGGLTAVEQNSDEEIASCVYVIAGTPVGTRVDNLEFGIPDPLFDTLPLEDDEILQAIERFEPRARVTDEQEFDGTGFGRVQLNVDGP